MIDFKKPDDATGTLVRIAGRKNTSTNHLQWDIDVAFEVDPDDEVLVPAQALTDGSPEPDVTVSDKTQRGDVKALLSDPETGEVVLENGAAIQTLKLRLKGTVAAVTVRFRMDGECGDSKRFTNLFDLLGCPVYVHCEPIQQPIPFTAKPKWQVGQLVTVGEDGAGMITAIQDDVVKVHNLVRNKNYKVSSLKKVIRVVALDNTDLDTLGRSYVRRAKKRGLDPSWGVVAVVLGEFALTKRIETNDNGEMIVTPDVIDRALELSPKVELPPEADVASPEKPKTVLRKKRG